MKNLLFFLAVCSLLTSCATILNGEKTRVFLYTEDPARVIYRRDTISTKEQNGFNAAALTVPRSGDFLTLTVVTDSLKKKIEILPKNSLSFYFNYNPAIFAALLIDWNSNKRYTYNSPLLLDKHLVVVKDIPSELKKDMSKRKKSLPDLREYRFPTAKGDIFLNLTFPYINYFSLSPSHEKRKDSFGFLGIGIGLDYYYKNNRSISLTTTGTMDFMVFVPAPVHYEGVHKHIGSWDVMLTHNHRYKGFTYGYGLAFARNSWHYNDEDKDIHYSRNASSLGIGLRSHYYFSSKFTVGLIYRPTFVVLNPENNKIFKYEHLLSIDFAFKFRLNKRK